MTDPCELCGGKYHTKAFHPCQLCPYVNHSTETHPCSFCAKLGHLPASHYKCDWCKEPDHETKEHLCTFCGKKGHLPGSHYKCTLCGHPNHETSQHVCGLCKKPGHKPFSICKNCNSGYKGCNCKDKSGIIQYCESRPYCGKCKSREHNTDKHPCDICKLPGCDSYNHKCNICECHGHDTSTHECSLCGKAGHGGSFYCNRSGRINHSEDCKNRCVHKYFCINRPLKYCTWCRTVGHTKETHSCNECIYSEHNLIPVYGQCGKLGYHWEHYPGFNAEKDSLLLSLENAGILKDLADIVFIYMK